VNEGSFTICRVLRSPPWPERD